MGVLLFMNVTFGKSHLNDFYNVPTVLSTINYVIKPEYLSSSQHICVNEHKAHSNSASFVKAKYCKTLHDTSPKPLLTLNKDF